MVYRHDIKHLSNQQQAIINLREQNDELSKKSSHVKVLNNEYKLSEEQLTILTMLKKNGTQHYTIFCDIFSDIESENQLKELDRDGYITYSEGNATIIEKGLKQVNNK